MSVLDDLKMIHERDAQDALGVAEKQGEQLQYRFEATHRFRRSEGIENVVLAGMGGSALAAQYIPSWPGCAVPFEIVRDYSIPSYVDSRTLFIASSYSGNTEETLTALTAAEEKGAKIVVVAAGGTLKERASKNGYPLYELPAGLQPRMAALYNLAALIQLLEQAEVLPAGSSEEMRAAGSWLSTMTADWRPDVKTENNQAKQLALEVVGSSPVIYGSSLTAPVAYKWKISFNENAKNVAWCNVYPEFNHNEFLGWTSHPIDKPYKVIDLRSSFDHPQTKKRFEISDRLLSGRRPAAIGVDLEGDSVLKQLLWGTALGDFVSLYTALLNGLNPTPVELIERFKKELVA